MNYSSTPSKPTKPLVVPLSEIQEYDYLKDFKPWTLAMIYEVEPELKTIAERFLVSRRCRFEKRHKAYSDIKDAAYPLLGWVARDPRLRHHAAWDCYFKYILDELQI